MSTLGGREGPERGVKGSEEGHSEVLDGRRGPTCRGAGSQVTAEGPGSIEDSGILPAPQDVSAASAGLGAAVRKEGWTQTANLKTDGGPRAPLQPCLPGSETTRAGDGCLQPPKFQTTLAGLTREWALGCEDPRVTRPQQDKPAPHPPVSSVWMSCDINPRQTPAEQGAFGRELFSHPQSEQRQGKGVLWRSFL